MKIINKFFYVIIYMYLGIFRFSDAFTSEIEAKIKAIHKLDEINSKLKITKGNILEDFTERLKTIQLMIIMFLSPDAKVLELGGHIGRSSCVIATLLKDSRNLVTFERDKVVAKRLKENRDYNKLKFNIETASFSKRPLIQNYWLYKSGKVQEKGSFPIDVYGLEETQHKYGIIFDTLICNCNNELHYVLKDCPDILKDIKLIIVENDCFDENGSLNKLLQDEEEFLYTINFFQASGFELIYQEDLFLTSYTIKDYYQVWKKL